MAEKTILPEEQKCLWERMLAEADGDYRRRRLVLLIIEFYKAPMEALLSEHTPKPVSMRHPARVHISSGVRQYGSCRMERGKKDICFLTFSRHLFFEGNLDRLRNVVCHEMLHACLPYSEGHGRKFRFFMEKVNEAFGTEIAVHSPEDAIQQTERLYKYKVVCGSCGNVTYYLRAGALIKNPGLFRCVKCRESNFIVEKLR